MHSSGFNKLERPGEQWRRLHCSSHQLIATWYETLSLFCMWSNLRSINMSSVLLITPKAGKRFSEKGDTPIYSAWLMSMCDVFNISNCCSGVYRINLIAMIPMPTFTQLCLQQIRCCLVFLLLFLIANLFPINFLSGLHFSLLPVLSVPLLLNLSHMFSLF